MQHSRLRDPLDIPVLLAECMKASFLKDIHFSRIYPNDPVNAPMIVWRLVARVMGKEGKETKKPRIRGHYDDGNNAVVIYGQWTTAQFQFDLISTSDEEVDELMRRFELFVVESRPTLVACGVDQFIFDEQRPDYSLPIPKEMPCRSLRYTAVMSTLYPAYTTRIRQIALHIASTGAQKDIAVVRTAAESDPIDVATTRIVGIAKTENADSFDYVAGVDYDLIDFGATATIKWQPYGLHPDEGTTYYVRISTLAEEVSFDIP